MEKPNKEVAVTINKNGAEIKKYDVEKPQEMTQMALALRTHIVKQELFTEIKGKNYAHVEGWQFAGGLIGIRPVVKEIEQIGTDTCKEWFVRVDLVNSSGEVVGAGASMASASERQGKNARWSDQYAILSMAQTRAIGKAYRNSLAWVMKLAGYEGTQKEEMPTDGGSEKSQDVDIEPYKKQLSTCKNVDELSKMFNSFTDKLQKNSNLIAYAQEMIEELPKEDLPVINQD